MNTFPTTKQRAKIGITKRIGMVLLVFFSMLCVWIVLPYSQCPVYVFPPGKPFAGSTWYNPYHGLTTDTPHPWRKVNFHAHSSAWRGLSHGVSTEDSLFAVYAQLGYDAASVSHYQYIYHSTKAENNIPVYEHGYGIMKNHQIIINARTEPVWMDFVLGQSVHHQQYMLEYLSKHHDSSYIVLAHPSLRTAYSPSDVAHLVPTAQWQSIEPFNFNAESVDAWDSALSAGRVLWGVGHDDTHNIFNPEETGVCWTMLADGMNSYRTGALYAVKMRSSLPDRWKHTIDSLVQLHILDSIPFNQRFGLRNAQNDVILLEHSLQRDSLGQEYVRLRFSAPVALVQCIGQYGTLQAQYGKDSVFTHPLQKTDSYLRIVAHTQNTTILLNPFVRTSLDHHIPRLAAPVIHPYRTAFAHSAWGSVYALLGCMIALALRIIRS